MKIKILASRLRKAISFTNQALKENKAYPLLENVSFLLSDKKLWVKVTDLRTTLVTSLPLDYDAASDRTAFLIPSEALGKLLATMVNKGQDEELTLNIDVETFNHSVKWSSGKQKLIGQNPTLYPPTPKFNKATSTVINFPPAEREAFCNALRTTAFACSTNDLKPAMLGVNVSAWPGGFVTPGSDFTIAATDGTVFAINQFFAAVPDLKFDVIITRSFVSAIVNTNEEAGANEAFSLTIERNTVKVVIGEAVLICQLIDEKYIAYQGVVDTILKYETLWTVERTALLAAVSRALLTTNQVTRTISIESGDNGVMIKSRDIDYGTSTEESVALVDVAGGSDSIYFHGTMLQKIVSNLEGENITIKFNSPLSPLLVYGQSVTSFCILGAVKPS